MKNILLRMVLVAFVLATMVQSARADLIVNAFAVGGNVVFSGGKTVDLDVYSIVDPSKFGSQADETLTRLLFQVPTEALTGLELALLKVTSHSNLGPREAAMPKEKAEEVLTDVLTRVNSAAQVGLHKALARITGSEQHNFNFSGSAGIGPLAIPEPGSLAPSVVLSLIGLVAVRCRRKSRKA